MRSHQMAQEEKAALKIEYSKTFIQRQAN